MNRILHIISMIGDIIERICKIPYNVYIFASRHRELIGKADPVNGMRSNNDLFSDDKKLTHWSTFLKGLTPKNYKSLTGDIVGESARIFIDIVADSEILARNPNSLAFVVGNMEI